ncbi:MAG: hypothetical protein EBQ99_06055 [Planctomycetes bacterium]|nr:hypothetical protein [Planctomycetota bacterium]
MNGFKHTWNETCERLGVKPKQFAALLAVLVVAVSVLGVRMMGGSRRAPKPQTVAARPAPAATPAHHEVRAVSMRKPEIPVGPVAEVSLHGSVARDPFRAWDAPATAVVREGAATRVASGTTEPGALPGLVLRAVVKGELAVFGEQTVRKGQSLMVGEEGLARVIEIGDRSVIVEFAGRSLEVWLGAAAEKPEKLAGGFR